MAAEIEPILARLPNLQTPREIKYALRVQAGATLVAPHAVLKEVHVYVEDRRGLEFCNKQMDFKNSAQSANFVLMLPYYKHAVSYDHRMIDG